METICLRGSIWRLYPCVLWVGVPNSAGYGIVYVPGDPVAKKRYVGAHRHALQQKLGRPIRNGYDACHHCDVKLCTQPEHLYEGTRKENMQDARERGQLRRKHRLSVAQREEVRSRIAAGGTTQKALALEYGVDPMTISNIKRHIYG